MTKGVLSGLLVVVLLSPSASGMGSVIIKTFKYYDFYYTWEEAQSHCRSSHIDLATLDSQNDPRGVKIEAYRAWTGLHRNSEGMWVWSTGQTASLADFNLQEPNGTEGCAYVHYPSKLLHLANCEDRYFYYCYDTSRRSPERQFIGKSETWSEALESCKNKYESLAYYGSLNALKSAYPTSIPVWIGLHKDGGDWKWSFSSSDYRKWLSSTANEGGDCVSINSQSKNMEGRNCSDKIPFVCMDDNVKLVKEKKSWEEALQHCRGMAPSGYDLLSVQPGDDHADILERAMGADTEEVWVGLRFLAGHWLWMTGADVSYPDLPQCPLQGEHCGALSKTSMTTVETRDCAERKNFLCYKK
ncbi:unnamed protein product [Ophioblennius macclurei]